MKPMISQTAVVVNIAYLCTVYRSNLYHSNHRKPPLHARDTMNTAQRMESASKAGCIHVSKSTKELLPKEQWEHTGGIEVSERVEAKQRCLVQSSSWGNATTIYHVA